MANTTNFGWETPDDTDLVKDGALAMRTLGNAIDTSLVDLKGGTTGQVLSKATNADMDFTWTNGGDITEVTAGTGLSGGGTSGAVTLTNTVATTFDAKGDLVVGTGADTFAKLTVGTNGHTLVADSATATGLKWAAPAAGGGLTLLETLTLSGSSTTSATISGDYVNLLLVVKGVFGTAQSQLDVRFNGDTGNNYYSRRFRNVNGTVSASTAAAASRFTDFITFDTSSTLTNRAYAVFRVFRYTDTDITYIETTGTFLETDFRSMTGQMLYDNSAAITSVTFLTSAGTFSGGTVYIYGEK